VCALLVLGVLFKRALVDPMLPHGVLPLVIATIALGLFLREAVKTLYSAEAQPFPTVVPEGVLRLQGIAVSVSDVAILLVAGTAVAALQLFLNRTPTGRAMQAVAQNRDVARILGIPVERMVLYTFLINAALVTLGSILISPVYLAKFSNGETLGLIAFVAAIVGGFNQIRGALVGGLLVGVLENVTAVYLSSEYRTAVPLLLLIVVVMLRPQGLLGRAEERRV
jgi:branched-chain amino acid transport system permease protein